MEKGGVKEREEDGKDEAKRLGREGEKEQRNI